MKYDKYIFVKDYVTPDGTINTGSELFDVNGTIHFNGGLVDPYFQRVFTKLIREETTKGFNYLKKATMIHNKL